jgi:hydrocephalus-inducing protein
VCTEREKFLVPLIASGERAVLNFPDHLDFGSNPTRSKTKRSFIVSNVGAKPTSFLLNTAGEFSVVPRQGELGPGETLQCSVEFQPTRQGPAVGEMEVVYESGSTATTTLYGEGHEIDVSLDMEAVAMLPTFVTRSSQKNFYLFNSSDRAVKFSWKSAGLNTDDFSSTAKRMHSLGRSLREELVGEGGEEGEDAEDELSDDSSDEDMMLTRRSTMVQRKYKRMYKDVDLDRQLFADDYYAITPLEGVVPAHGQVQFTVRFSPDHQRQFTATAYCEVEGREARLPIALSGVGCGPNVIFSYDVLDVGDTFVNTLHQYEVQLQNRGEIEAPYQLLRMDSSPFSSKFSFEPDAGVLAPGQVNATIHLLFVYSYVRNTTEGILRVHNLLMRRHLISQIQFYLEACRSNLTQFRILFRFIRRVSKSG